MERQLVLIDTTERSARPNRAAWKLDEHTKQLGRKGIAEARKLLQQSAPKTAA